MGSAVDAPFVALANATGVPVAEIKVSPSPSAGVPLPQSRSDELAALRRPFSAKALDSARRPAAGPRTITSRHIDPSWQRAGRNHPVYQDTAK